MSQTIKEAKQFLRENWEKGVDCPCCGRAVKKYKYKLDASKAYGVILVYKLQKRYPDRVWFHLTKEIAREFGVGIAPLHYTKMKYYGFIISDRDNPDPTKKSSGLWCITKKGIDFVEKKIKVPSRFYVYDGKCLGFDGEDIDITQALAEKFDYRELLEGI